jgi:hypothetical protein
VHESQLALTLTQTAWLCCGLFDSHTFWEKHCPIDEIWSGGNILSLRRILPPDQSSTFGRHFPFRLPITPRGTIITLQNEHRTNQRTNKATKARTQKIKKRRQTEKGGVTWENKSSIVIIVLVLVFPVVSVCAV